MFAILASVASLMLAVGLLQLGSGMFNTFIGLRAAFEGFPKEITGLLMSAYYAGLVVGTLVCGRLVNRAGHIRAFGVFCAITAASILAIPLLPNQWAWVALRAMMGINLAGLYMVAESWLNAKATGQHRGTLLAVYMMTCYLCSGSGQLLVGVVSTETVTAFMLVAICFSLALVPVAVTRASHPAPVDTSHFSIRKLWAVSPLAIVGCVVSGLGTGAIYGMGPIYGQDIGFTQGQIATFMGITVIGGLVFQFPVGWLSDRFDRRWVIVGATLAAALASFVVVVVIRQGYFAINTPSGTFRLLYAPYRIPLYIISATYGGFIATIYPLCVAYANDYIDAQDMVHASAGLVLAYGVGAAIGPSAAAALMGQVGPDGLFIFTGTVTLGLVAFAAYRMRRRHWVPVAEKENFVVLPEAVTTPVATESDPRSESGQLALELELPWEEAQPSAT